MTREITSEADLQNLREQARMDAKLSGNAAIDVAINGVNYVGKIGHGAQQLFQRLEINQSPSAALTFLHESIEADFRLGVKSGAISEAHAQQAIASIAHAFDPQLARTGEERAFRERVQRVARGEANAIELRETLTELAVADVLGRRKDGSTMPARSVTASLDEAIRDTTDAAQVRDLGTVRAFLRNVRNNLRAMFGTAAALKKARRNGSTAEFDALVNKLFGKDWQAANEWAGSEEVFGAAFSIRSLSSVESLAKADSQRLGEIRDALPKLPAVPRLETPQEAFLWFEKNLAGKSIPTRAGFSIEFQPGHFSVLTAAQSADNKQKGFVEGFATAEDFRSALRDGRISAEQIPGYNAIRARQLQLIESTLREGLPLRSIKEPWKISFAASIEQGGFVVIAFDTRDGRIGILSAHDRKLNDTFLRRYEIVAPPDTGSGGVNREGAMPVEHSATLDEA